MPIWAIALIIFGSVGVVSALIYWSRPKTSQTKPEKKESVSRYKSYSFFPLTRNDGQYISWSVDRRLENSYLVTENILRQEMWGGFTHNELAFAVLSGLLERGWLPPGMTAEEVQSLKEDIDKKRQND